MPWNSLSVNGPMARSVADTALLLDAMAGTHPEDPLSIAAPQTPFLDAARAPMVPARLAFTPDLGLFPVDREVAELCLQAVTRLGFLISLPAFTVRLVLLVGRQPTHAVFDQESMYGRSRDLDLVKALQVGSDPVRPEMIILSQVQNLADNSRRRGSGRGTRHRACARPNRCLAAARGQARGRARA